MASGANKIPYLGCKISLISNAEIRYEGILYTVDVKDSTLALAKVVSFGTEDRPTDKPVSQRSEVYDYIIFRATDIKDVRVCESPKTRSSSIEADPAIVKHSDPASSLGYPFPPANFRPPPSSAGPFGNIGSPPAGYSVSLFDVLSGSRGGPQRQHDRHQQNDRRQRAQQQPRRRTTSDNSQGEHIRPPRSPHPGRSRRVSFLEHSPRREGQRQNDQRRNRQQPQGHQGLGQQRGGQRGRGGGGSRGRGGGRGRGGWVNRGRGGFWGGRPRSSSLDRDKNERSRSYDVIKTDFDFDAAEQEFQKLFSTMKLGKAVESKPDEEVEAPTPFVIDRNVSSPKKYDKNASFFDLSSEPLPEEPQPRQDWRKELKISAETFGQAEVRRARFYIPRNHRGGYRFNRGGHAHSGVPPGAVRYPEQLSPTKSPTVLLNPVLTAEREIELKA